MTFRQNQIDFLFDQLIHRPWGYACWQPMLDVFETSQSYRIVMDLPGMAPDEIHISVGGGHITIEGSRLLPENAASRRICCSERPRGEFRRTVDIPKPVEADIDRRYEQGVLTITLQKRRTGESS